MSPIEALHHDPSGDPARDKSERQFELDPTKVTRQRMLTAAEIVKLLDADYERLKQEFGELHSGAAYGRISWKIRIELGIARAFDPKPFIEQRSRRIASNVVSENAALAAVEPHPLPDADGVASVELERRVNSPNLERIRNGIPIPTTVTQRDGTHTIEPITYPKPAPGEPGHGDGDITVTDSSKELATAAGANWNLTDEEAALLDAINAESNAAAEAAQAAAATNVPVDDAQRTEANNELLDPLES